MPTKFISFDRLSRYTQKLKSYVGSQIQAAKTEWQNQLKLKVDKVTGKGLSTNDFTNEYKTKLDKIESGAQKNTVTGIKGNSESAYRKGNVNLTKANIGLGNVENLSSYAILNKIEAIHVKKGLGYSPACYIQISLPIAPDGSFTAKSSVRFGRKVSYEYYRSAGAMPVPSWPIGKLEGHFQIVSFYPKDSSMSMDEFNKIVSIDISSVEDMGDGFMDFVVYFEEKPSTSFYVTLNIMYSDITAS